MERPAHDLDEFMADVDPIEEVAWPPEQQDLVNE
jgi:hypothetical protein